MSVGEVLMTLRISAVAVCCSRASVSPRSFSCRASPVAFSRSRLSARRFSSSRILAVRFFGDLRVAGRLALACALAGFPPRPIGLSWSRKELGANHARQGLQGPAAAIRAAATVVQPVVAAGGLRLPVVMAERASPANQPLTITL